MKRFLVLSMAVAMFSATAMAKDSGYYAFHQNATQPDAYQPFPFAAWASVGTGVDFTNEVEFAADFDALTEFNGEDAGFVIFGSAENIQVAVNPAYPGEVRLYTNGEDRSDPAAGDLVSSTKGLKFILSRTGTTVTYSYQEAGGSVVDFHSATAALTDNSIGFSATVGNSNTQQWDINNISITIAGATNVYDGSSAWVEFDASWFKLNQYDAVPATSTNVRDNDAASAYPGPTDAVWTIAFNEPVTGVDITDFVITHTGDSADAGSAVVDNGDNSFTVTLTGVTGTGSDATVGLDFVGAGVTTTAGGVSPADASFDGYASVPPPPSLPAANTWALLAMGMLLSLAAAFVIRKQAMNS